MTPEDEAYECREALGEQNEQDGVPEVWDAAYWDFDPKKEDE